MAPRPSPPRHRPPPRALPLPLLLVRLLVASLSLLQLPARVSADTPITLLVQDNVAAKMDTYTYTFAAGPLTRRATSHDCLVTVYQYMLPGLKRRPLTVRSQCTRTHVPHPKKWGYLLITRRILRRGLTRRPSSPDCLLTVCPYTLAASSPLAGHGVP